MNGERPLTMDLEMIVPVAFDWDRDGDFDLIVGDEYGRVAFVENLGRVVDRLPQFTAPRYFQQEADELQCGALSTPVGCDWDGDGDIDIVSGNTSGYIKFFENLSGPRVASPKWAAPRRLSVAGSRREPDSASTAEPPPLSARAAYTFRVMAGPNGSIQGPAEAKWGYTTHNVADWDSDGLPDIVFNSIWGRVQWLRNIGTRTAPKLDEPQPANLLLNHEGIVKVLDMGLARIESNELGVQQAELTSTGAIMPAPRRRSSSGRCTPGWTGCGSCPPSRCRR